MSERRCLSGQTWSVPRALAERWPRRRLLWLLLPTFWRYGRAWLRFSLCSRVVSCAIGGGALARKRRFGEFHGKFEGKTRERLWLSANTQYVDNSTVSQTKRSAIKRSLVSPSNLPWNSPNLLFARPRRHPHGPPIAQDTTREHSEKRSHARPYRQNVGSRSHGWRRRGTQHFQHPPAPQLATLERLEQTNQ